MNFLSGLLIYSLVIFNFFHLYATPAADIPCCAVTVCVCACTERRAPDQYHRRALEGSVWRVPPPTARFFLQRPQNGNPRARRTPSDVPGLLDSAAAHGPHSPRIKISARATLDVGRKRNNTETAMLQSLLCAHRGYTLVHLNIVVSLSVC